MGGGGVGGCCDLGSKGKFEGFYSFGAEIREKGREKEWVFAGPTQSIWSEREREMVKKWVVI